MNDPTRYDLVVIGSGPAGQKAAIQGAKGGWRVAVVERDSNAGGACVRHGTIPSKTLRETTVALATFRDRSGDVLKVDIPENLKVESLMTRLDEVVQGHQRYIQDQLDRNGITTLHGRARFLSDHALEVLSVDGSRREITATVIVIAAGSEPRTPPGIPVDHETILDSDSILSLTYLPRTLTILGAGVIASEYASTFATLGCQVTMVEKYPRPLGFLDPELTDRFVRRFEANGGRYVGSAKIRAVTTDGLRVTTHLDNDEIITTDKMLCALGRVASLHQLDAAAAGLQANERGLLSVDEHCRTDVPHIYAVGDVIGPPALAASAMEQGRRAVCHALGIEAGGNAENTPVGIYTIPEIACVGITEEEARKRHGGAVVGRARYQEIARGHILRSQDGLLKMVADPTGTTLLGVHIIGEGATELIHLGQMALINHSPVETFIEHIFNFPTLAEAYRVAALDLTARRPQAQSQERVSA